MKLLPWLLGGAAAVLTGGAALGALPGLGAAAGAAGAAGAGGLGGAAAGAAGAGAAGAGAAGAAGASALGAGLAAPAATTAATAGGIGGAAGLGGAAGAAGLPGAATAATGAAGAGSAGAAGAAGLGANFFPAAPGAAGLGGAGAANTTLGAVVGAPGAASAAGSGGLAGAAKGVLGTVGKIATPSNLLVGGMVANQLGLFNGGGGGGEDEEEFGEAGKKLDRDYSPRQTDFNHDPLKDTSQHNYFPGVGYADGGPVQGGDQPDQAALAQIQKGAVAAIEGRHPQPREALELYLEFFGPDALEDLMAEVKSEGLASSKVEQMSGGIGAVKGEGDGMSDSIPATIDGRQPARLATDEHVIPADVVSGLGNGSSDAGHKALRAMTEGVRQAKGGQPSQPQRIDPSMFMPG